MVFVYPDPSVQKRLNVSCGSGGSSSVKELSRSGMMNSSSTSGLGHFPSWIQRFPGFPPFVV